MLLPVAPNKKKVFVSFSDVRDEFNASSDEDLQLAKFVRKSDLARKRGNVSSASSIDGGGGVGVEPAPKRPFTSSAAAKKPEGFVSFASMVSPDHSATHFNLNLNRQNGFLKPRDSSGRFVRSGDSEKKPKRPDSEVAPPVIKFEADFSDEKVENSEAPILPFRKPFDRVENYSRLIV